MGSGMGYNHPVISLLLNPLLICWLPMLGNMHHKEPFSVVILDSKTDHHQFLH